MAWVVIFKDGQAEAVDWLRPYGKQYKECIPFPTLLWAENGKYAYDAGRAFSEPDTEKSDIAALRKEIDELRAQAADMLAQNHALEVRLHEQRDGFKFMKQCLAQLEAWAALDTCLQKSHGERNVFWRNTVRVIRGWLTRVEKNEFDSDEIPF